MSVFWPHIGEIGANIDEEGGIGVKWWRDVRSVHHYRQEEEVCVGEPLELSGEVKRKKRQ